MPEQIELSFTQEELEVILRWASEAGIKEEEKSLYEYIYFNIPGNAR